MPRWNRPYGFLNVPEDGKEPKVGLFGAPYDRVTSGRPGGRYAPAAIRQASRQLESYSPLIEQDLQDIQAVDRGDLDLKTTSPKEAMSRIQEAAQQLIQQGMTPVMMAGDPLCSLPLFLSLLTQHPDLMVLQLDAHTGLRAEYLGETHCHHTVMHHIHEEIKDPQRIIVYGTRSGTKAEFEMAKRCRVCGPFPSFDHQRLTALRYHLEAVHYRPILVTCDLDVFDPSVSPGVSYPEPGGILYEEFRHLLTYLKGRNIVGVSVAGCCPPADSSDVSATLAAKVVRELSLLPSVYSLEASNA